MKQSNAKHIKLFAAAPKDSPIGHLGFIIYYLSFFAPLLYLPTYECTQYSYIGTLLVGTYRFNIMICKVSDSANLKKTDKYLPNVCFFIKLH